MELLPRLGDSRTGCRERLGPPLWTETPASGEGLLVQQYPSRLGPLTVLFDQGCSVAFYLRYASPRPQTTALRVAAACLASAAGGGQRLLVDDEGWFLVAARCSTAALQLFVCTVLSPTRHAARATWARAAADRCSAARAG